MVWGSNPVTSQELLSSPKHPDQLWAHSASSLKGNGVSAGIKWPGRDVDSSPPSSADVRNEWGYSFEFTICGGRKRSVLRQPTIGRQQEGIGEGGENV